MGTEWKTLATSTFKLEVPEDFYLKNGNGIDSYAGSIVGRNLEFDFDYGYYTNNQPLTDVEIATHILFRGIVFDEFKKQIGIEDSTITKNQIRDKIKIESVDEQTLEVVGVYDGYNWSYKLPYYIDFDGEDDFNNYNITLDRVDGYSRKLFYPNSKNSKLYGVILKGEFDTLINNNIALRITAYNKSAKNFEVIKQILESARILEKDN